MAQHHGSRHSLSSAALLAAFLLAIAGTAATAAAASGAGPNTVAGAAPAWVKNIQPGTWAAISKNKVSDLDPKQDPEVNPKYPSSSPWNGTTGQRSVIQSWNGAAFAAKYGPKGSLVLWGGGHQNYYGNEIYAFDLASSSWQRVTDPYSGDINFPVTNGIFPDGTPSPPHTYGFGSYHPATNSYVVFKLQVSNTPSSVALPAFFDFDTKRWRFGPKNSQNSSSSGGWAVYDNSRDVYWMEGGDGTGVFARFDPKGDGTSGTWTNYSQKLGKLDNRAARDPINDIIVIASFRTTEDMYGLDLDDPAASEVLLKQGGSPPSSKEHASGWEWSDARQAFIYWRRDSGVYQVKLSGSDWRTGTWTWSELTDSANTVTPDTTTNGIYNRFQIVRYDDAEVAIVVGSVDSPVYAFRIPGAEAIIRPNPPTSITIQ